MIRLVITDIDGTLLDEGQTNLNPEYFDIIRKLTECGVTFAVATGRHAVSVKKTFGPVLDCIWIVSQNGSVIEHNGVSRVLKPLPREWAEEFWQDLSQYPEVESLLNTDRRTYCPFPETNMFYTVRDSYGFDIHATGGWDRLPEGEEFSMVTIYHPQSAEAFCKTSHIPGKWSDRLDILPTGKTWVDCMIPGISKGDAMLRICSDLDIDPADTIAFGDNMNDISMIHNAGTGYAVDTARAEVQEAADRVIPGFRVDGVLKELKSIFADLF